MAFKVGDIVTLKCGGPAMLVWEVRSDGLLGVEWFAEDNYLQKDAFAEIELIAWPIIPEEVMSEANVRSVLRKEYQ